MSNWLAIQPSLHQKARWKNHTGYSFAQQDTTASLLMVELSSAVQFYPIGFVKDEAGVFKLVAIQSLEPSLNVFVNTKGQWRVPYVPSVYRGYPFRMLKADAESDDAPILCVDTDSGQFDAAPDDNLGQPLFDEDGALSEMLKKVVDFLDKRDQNRVLTERAVAALSDAELIVPWGIQARLLDGEESTINGLFKIDQERLKALSGDVLETLNKVDALTVAHAQILSLPRLAGLSHFYQQHQMEQEGRASKQVDLEKFFSENDDSLTF